MINRFKKMGKAFSYATTQFRNGYTVQSFTEKARMERTASNRLACLITGG